MARPVLAALAEQQKTIDSQAGLLAQANRQISDQARRIADQDRTIGQFKQVFAAQRDQLSAFGRGLSAIARAAGIEGHVKSAMQRTADEQNPAQPIPEPPAQPPAQTTQDAKTPEAFGDVMAPGMVPGSTNDVAADATSTVYTPGNDIDAPALKSLVDVTAPVDGTQTPRPLDEVRTLTDVRVGNPANDGGRPGMNPQTAFPLRGDFANAQRLGAREAASNRTMAALRLARLRITAGTASGDNDFAVATEIEKDASLTTEAIEAEIHTLENVSKAASAKQSRPAGLVPRAASNGQRSVPSMQAVGNSGTPGAPDDVADSDLFM